MIKAGSIVLFNKCVCGDGGLTSGTTYTILEVQYPLFIFKDDNGKKRVRNINSRCFKIIEE